MFHFKNKEIKDLFQWSRDIVLEFDQIYAGEEAHFSNNKINSLNKKINENGEVTIPNILLTESTPIEVYLFIKEGPEQYTKKKKILPVIARPKPEDYIYTEEENKIWDNKVDIFQGEENSRKILSTDENGKVVTKISTDEIITNKDIPLPTSEDEGKYLGCENGAAAWMPVEASGGGGGDKWEFLNTIEISEVVNRIRISTDKGGNPFSLKRAIVVCELNRDMDDPFTYIKMKANGLTISNNQLANTTSEKLYYCYVFEHVPGFGIFADTFLRNQNVNWIFTMEKMGYKHNDDYKAESIKYIEIIANDGNKNVCASAKIDVFGVRA